MLGRAHLSPHERAKDNRHRAHKNEFEAFDEQALKGQVLKS